MTPAPDGQPGPEPWLTGLQAGRAVGRSPTKGRAVMAGTSGRHRTGRFTRGAAALRAHLDRALSMILILFYFFKPVLAAAILLAGLVGILAWRLTRAWLRWRR